MILATPLVPELADFEKYAAKLKAKGQLRSHVHLILCRTGDEVAAIEFDEATRALFFKSAVRLVAPEANNVALSNAFLREGCTFLRDHEEEPGEPAGVPMLYNDPTWGPTRVGWLNEIQAEFYANRMPTTMGRWEDPKADEKVIWGPLVINRAYPATSGLMAFLNGTDHWRHYLRHELGRDMVTPATIGRGKDAVLRPPPKPKS